MNPRPTTKPRAQDYPANGAYPHPKINRSCINSAPHHRRRPNNPVLRSAGYGAANSTTTSAIPKFRPSIAFRRPPIAFSATPIAFSDTVIAFGATVIAFAATPIAFRRSLQGIVVLRLSP